jgi:hypothetical protein
MVKHFKAINRSTDLFQLLKHILAVLSSGFCFIGSNAQNCPANIDFETG